jgi:phosphoesterase RecJ-like protein
MVEIKSSEDLSIAADFIQEHDHILIVSHVNPDGDAIGSTLAMGHLLRSLGKSYVMANEGKTPQRFAFLNSFEHIKDLSEQILTGPVSAIITVDVADYDRLGNLEHLNLEHLPVLNIDHHPTNTLFGLHNVIQTTAASTTEILFDLIQQHFNSHICDKLAEALYTGLLTDTGGFRYSNTSEAVLTKASQLISYGVNPARIAEHCLETISLPYIQLLKQSLLSLSLHGKQRIAMMQVTLEDMAQSQAQKDDVDGLVSYPRNIEGVEIGVLLKEVKPGEVKVSLRSKHIVDVSQIAQGFGGGGHAKASGYTWFGTLQEAKSELLSKLEEALGDEKFSC